MAHRTARKKTYELNTARGERSTKKNSSLQVMVLKKIFKKEKECLQEIRSWDEEQVISFLDKIGEKNTKKIKILFWRNSFFVNLERYQH